MTRRTFGLRAGDLLGEHYQVEERLGRGWEGEVYRVRERATDIRRAAKLFFPERNKGNRTLRRNARKLDRLADCPVIINYHHLECMRFGEQKVHALISELVEGERLDRFLRNLPGRRMRAFQALHLLHALARGVEQIHLRRDYHGDLHDSNVLVRRKGIGFAVKLLDIHPRGRADRTEQREDLIQLIRIFYDAVGGRREYARQPAEVKRICAGLRRDLIVTRFPTMSHLRHYLETFEWEDPGVAS